MVTCIPTLSQSVLFVGSAWKLGQSWARENALWCVDGLEYQASQACDKREFFAKSSMCNCVYYFGPKVEATAQIGSTKIFQTAKAQINSNFFYGVSSLEWGISDKNHAMGIHVHCGNVWQGINEMLARWKQGNYVSGAHEIERRRGLVDVHVRDELK
ncbi:hypothetical protein BGZ52_007890, partial [Haplosporangium bisporale]